MSMIARTTVVLGVITVGFVSLAYTHPAAKQVTEQHPLRVAMSAEPVSTTPKADRLSLFDRRWDQMPTVAEIRTIPLDKPEAPPPPPLIAKPEREPEHRKAAHEDRSRDVCERHHMHKEYIRGGRSWRCRK